VTHYAIWKRTGGVYEIGPGGDVEDDPVFLPVRIEELRAAVEEPGA
jgi:hypothetical protein